MSLIVIESLAALTMVAFQRRIDITGCVVRPDGREIRIVAASRQEFMPAVEEGPFGCWLNRRAYFPDGYRTVLGDRPPEKRPPMRVPREARPVPRPAPMRMLRGMCQRQRRALKRRAYLQEIRR